MDRIAPVSRIDQQLIEGLYLEAIVLADEARAFFDCEAGQVREQGDGMLQLDFACESLKVSTRIMHSIAWLLFQRAILAGDLPESSRLDPERKLGEADGTEPEVRARLSPEMEGLILVSEDLYGRVVRLQEQLIERANLGAAFRQSPARSLLNHLERSI